MPQLAEKSEIVFPNKQEGKRKERVHTFPLNSSISPPSYKMITFLVHFSPVKPQPSFEMSIWNVPESPLQKSYQIRK